MRIEASHRDRGVGEVIENGAVTSAGTVSETGQIWHIGLIERRAPCACVGPASEFPSGRMTAIAQTLDAKLKQWRPATARKVVRQVTAIIKNAEQETRGKRTIRASASKTARDPLLTDQVSFAGRTPADLARDHDRYLYDAGA